MAKKQISQALRRRAESILNNKRQYDTDTRDAVQAALRRGADDLAETVKRAEAGETIWDLEAVENQQADAAKAILACIEFKGMPDFITDAVINALEAARSATGVSVSRGEGLSPSLISKVIAMAGPMFSLPAGGEETPDFSERVSTVPKRDFADEILTPEQSAAIVGEWINDFLDNDETVGKFLLLIRTLVYEPELLRREDAYLAIENHIMPYTKAAERAIDDLVHKTHAALAA